MQVSIIHPNLPYYRVDFFTGLRSALAHRGIVLNLFYGKNLSATKKDECDLDWAHPVPNRRWGYRNLSVCWQQVPNDILKSDLIVLTQENKFLSGHVLLAKALARRRKVAFWGHGLNRQTPPDSVGNTIKKAYICSVSWWFAYTEGVKALVASLGFPSERITVVQNAIDTQSICDQAARIDEHASLKLRASMAAGDGPIGLYCGAMYKGKRLPFLLAACHKIRELVPDFEMVFIGAGPDSHIVADAAGRHNWIHYVGPKFREEVVPFMKLADVFLMPGSVGLGILDAFALQKPFITTTDPGHGPEVEYLINGENGIMTEDSLEAFVAGTVGVLSSTDLSKRLSFGCSEAARTYTVEHMIENYVRGVETALAT